ncbi:hypothetical protein Hsero_3753 [Herbaspirillum seropedicae SmR1]|uniref:Uncharacterized protein n=1 Tax=Herbaspirillum seropedicae (strain SmR1) TaxID=757424 RepID=D8IRA5_HERSS|nr:hypothetical protein Hsero_3753 [Herbaspirillum seropedicae SmR1]
MLEAVGAGAPAASAARGAAPSLPAAGMGEGGREGICMAASPIDEIAMHIDALRRRLGRCQEVCLARVCNFRSV